MGVVSTKAPQGKKLLDRVRMEAAERHITRNLEDGGATRSEGLASTLNSEESTHMSIRGQNSCVGLSQLQARESPHPTPKDKIPAGIHSLSVKHGEDFCLWPHRGIICFHANMGPNKSGQPLATVG